MSAQTSTAIHNEQIKLAANLFNNIAVALIVTGVIVPLAAFAFQTTVPHGRFWLIYTLPWVAAAALYHLIARHLLTRITP